MDNLKTGFGIASHIGCRKRFSCFAMCAYAIETEVSLVARELEILDLSSDGHLDQCSQPEPQQSGTLSQNGKRESVT